jgi:hypothetical protein
MKKTALMRRTTLIYLFSIVLIISSVFFTACNDTKTGDHEEELKNVKLNCVTITKAQIQAWVDSGWTKPGSEGEIKEVVLQFFANSGGRSFQLIGYPGKTPIDVKDNGKIVLGVDTSCVIKPFLGDFILGNNILKLEKLNIFNQDGTLRNFDFIKLSPEQQYPPYINFKTEIITGGQAESGGGGGGTLPCPIHCG